MDTGELCGIGYFKLVFLKYLNVPTWLIFTIMLMHILHDSPNFRSLCYLLYSIIQTNKFIIILDLYIFLIYMLFCILDLSSMDNCYTQNVNSLHIVHNAHAGISFWLVNAVLLGIIQKQYKLTVTKIVHIHIPLLFVCVWTAVVTK